MSQTEHCATYLLISYFFDFIYPLPIILSQELAWGEKILTQLKQTTQNMRAIILFNIIGYALRKE